MVAVGSLRGVLRYCLVVLFAISPFGLVGCDGEVTPSPTASPSLTSIEITPLNTSAAAGTSVQLSATAVYSDNSHQDVTSQATWTSSNIAVATVGGTPGTAKAIAAGSVVIGATYRGQTNSTTLTITPATLVSVALTPPSASIAAGTQQSFTAMGTFSDNSVQNVSADMTWASSNPTVATVGEGGLVSSLTPGTTSITATCAQASVCGVIGGSVTLTVTAATLVSIEVTPPSPSIALGTTRSLQATGLYTDHSKQDLTSQVVWSSSEVGVATISNVAGSRGKVTTVAVGDTQISASSGGITSNSATLTVTAATLVSIAVTPASQALPKGLSEQLTAIGTYTDNSTQDLTSQVTWSSSTTNVATISNASGTSGLASAVDIGSTVISAALGSTSGNYTLTVTTATLVSIGVTPVSPSVSNGLSEQFTAIGTYTDNTTQDLTDDVTWMSSVPSVATVSNAPGTHGLATSAGVGTTVITASAGTVSGDTTLGVTAAALVSIAVTPVLPSVAKGLPEQFTATGTYTDNTTRDLTAQVTWSSSAAGIATISNAAGSNGLASSAGVGSATITATLGATAGNSTLTVTAATLVSIGVTPAFSSVAKGLAEQLIAIGTYTDNTTQNLTTQVTWSSSASGIATVSNAAGTNGLANCASVGITTITAAMGSISGNTTLTVTPAALVSIAVAPALASVPAGSAVQFSATGTYTDSSMADITTQVTWSSSSGSVATISNAIGSNGLARSAATGTTVIVAAVGSVSGYTRLTVTAATLVSVAVSPALISIPKGTKQQFTAVGTYTDNSTMDITLQVTWSSSATGVASISNANGSKGLATAVNVGSGVITAVLGSTTGTTSLTVTPATWASIRVDPSNPLVVYGGTQQFAATGTLTDGSTQDITQMVTWSSSNAAAAVISNATGSNGLASVPAAATVADTSSISATIGSITGNTTLTVSSAVGYAYVVNNGDNTVSEYAIGSMGALTPLGTVAAGQQPVSAIADPTGNYVYVANYGSDTISEYAIGPLGRLTPTSTVSIGAGDGPTALATDSSGKYLYVANRSSNDIFEYEIGPDGVLSQGATPSIAAGSGPNSMVLSGNGNNLYAVNDGNVISIYNIGATGALALQATQPIRDGTQSAFGITTDPAGQYAYIGDSTGFQGIGYYIIAGGSLIPKGSFFSSCLPASIAVSNNAAYYLCNSSNMLVMWGDVNGTPDINAIHSYTTGSHPSKVVLDRSGQFLYVANLDDNTIAQYSVGSGGLLTRMSIATVPAGASPVWITTVGAH